MSTLSPNMNLSIPTVGVDIGPTYAYQINTSLSLIDSHNHSPGSGVPITPSGININAMLTFNDNPATNLEYAGFAVQASASTALQSLSVAPTSSINELWYTDSNGTQTQITANGAVNATIGSLPGESYAAGTFTWVQGNGSTTPANFDIGGITIRPTTAGTTNGVILQPNGSIASQYTLSLPLIPAAKNLVSITTGGVIAADVNVDNSTLNFSGTVLSVKNGGITTTQISNSANITGGQLSASANIASTQLAACSLANHTNALAYSNGTTSFTTIVSLTASPANSRPFAVQFDGQSVIFTDFGSGIDCFVRLINTTDNITYYTWGVSLSPGQVLAYPISVFNSIVGINGAVTASSTIALQAKVATADGTTVTTIASTKAWFIGW